MKQKKNIFVQIWYVAYPLLFYYAVALIVMSLCQWLLGSDDEHFVMCQLVSTVITIPFMMPFYRSANYFDFSVVKSSSDQVKKNSSLPEGGHYASACKNFGKWYLFDDASFFECDDDMICTQEGYILFYKKCKEKSTLIKA